MFNTQELIQKIQNQILHYGFTVFTTELWLMLTLFNNNGKNK